MNRLSSGLGIWQIISTNIITDIINKMDSDNKFINKKKNEIKLVLYNNKNNTIDGINLIKN